MIQFETKGEAMTHQDSAYNAPLGQHIVEFYHQTKGCLSISDKATT